MSIPKTKILIVDPDQQAAEFLKDDLTEDGYDATMVTTDADAFTCATTGAFKLAIIDRNLADINSLRLCEKIRAEALAEQLSIIVISSFDDDEDRANALSLGADEYLCKPFRYSALSQLVARLVEH